MKRKKRIAIVWGLVAALIAGQFGLLPAKPAQAEEGGEVNVALGAGSVTTNGVVTNGVRLELLTDGDRNRANYALISTADGPKYVQVDLGESFEITRINIANDYGLSYMRSMRGVVVQVSNDPNFASGVTTLFNNDADNSSGLGAGSDASYVEPTDGSGLDIVPAVPVAARYMRYSAYGHVQYGTGQIHLVNVPVEIEVYTAAPAVDNSLASVTDLAAGSATVNSAVLTWTAPAGAAAYDVRYALEPITEANWDNGLVVRRASGEPVPGPAGTGETMTVKGLPHGSVVYFALRTVDADGDVSPLSNIAQVQTRLAVNVARGKEVTSNGTATAGTSLANVTDGVLGRTNYALISTADGPKYVQIDLGEEWEIAEVRLINDWGSSSATYRTGNDYVLQLSNDPDFLTGVTTIFNNDADNTLGLGAGTDPEYVEYGDGGGRTIALEDTVWARYVRFWGNGHTRVNGEVHQVNTPVEIEVYADPNDAVPPDAVTDLAYGNLAWKSVELTWTAPGDDGAVGTAAAYDLRYATSPLDESTWHAATPVAGVPAPAPAGTPQQMTVEGLLPNTTYYFAMKVRDDALNWSALSNVLTFTTPAEDAIPPAAVTDLTAFNANIRSVELTWTAPGNDGMTGTAASYEVRYATFPITEANWDEAVPALDPLRQLPAGSTMTFQVNELEEDTTYYFAVKTFDDVGNVSALSNVVSATTYTPTPDSVTVYSLAELQQAIDEAPPGGRIITLAPGVYNQTTSINITNKNNITIQGGTNNFNDTVLNGPGITGPLDINIKINRSDYVTLRNFTTQNTSAHGVQVNDGSDYFHADNLRTWDHGEGGFKVTGPNWTTGRPYSDYGIIENSHMGYTTTGMLSSVESVNLIATRGWIIRGNRIENTFHPNYGGGYGIFAKGGAIDTIIENNYLRNNFIAASFGGGGTDPVFFRNGDTQYEHVGGIMRNYVIYKTGDTGIYMNKAHNFAVYNNTILDTYLPAIQSRYVQSTGVISNNLMNKGIQLRDGGTYTGSNNITNADYSLFVDAAGEDFHLNPATAAVAIDQGVNVPEVAYDMDGDPRPYGASTDIGADEVVPAPDAPTGLAAAAGDGEVALSWAAADRATKYNVKRSTASGGPYTTIAAGVAGTSYTDTDVLNGTTYYYVVSAVNAGGESADSAEASATPEAPETPTPPSGDSPLDRSGWTASASKPTNAAYALDGDLGTRWTSSAAQKSGQYYQVNFGSPRNFNKLVLDAGPSWPNDYPVGFEVLVSNDGVNWTGVATGAGSGRVKTVTFPTQTAQYVRIALTTDGAHWWSIAEVLLYP
jgi:hypothetical protein